MDQLRAANHRGRRRRVGTKYLQNTDTTRGHRQHDENIYIETVRSIRAATKIPLAIKLSPYFSSFANMAISLDDLNVDGLVLFNRFYQPDIDLEKMEVTPNFTLSTPADMRLPLHWIGILYGKLRASLAATSGIYQAQDVIKLVMAGADVTMLCSALMRHGIPHIQRIEMDLVAWLEQHQRKSLAEIKGIMSQQNCPDPSAFERAQYVRGFPATLRCSQCGDGE
jgi:Dihydroorotate dehydrogenase